MCKRIYKANDTAFGVAVSAAVATQSALAGLEVTTSSDGIFLQDNTGADMTVKIAAISDADGQINVLRELLVLAVFVVKAFHPSLGPNCHQRGYDGQDGLKHGQPFSLVIDRLTV